MHTNKFEHARGLDAVRRFARDLALSEEGAVELYARESARLQDAAKISRYVHLLAEKRTCGALRRMRRATLRTR
jgi:hypothetical protein